LTHCNVRIGMSSGARIVVGKLEEIEVTNFIRAVVRAKPRSDTAVINLYIQPFAVVHGCSNRAYDFTRSVLAMLASHGLELRTLIGFVAIQVYTYPVHLTTHGNLFRSDDGDIVLCLTCDSAGVAAYACVQVHGHAPGVTVVRMLGVQGRRGCRRVRSVDSLALQAGHADGFPSLRAELVLRAGELMT